MRELTSKFFQIPHQEEEILKTFFKQPEIDKWGFYTLLFPAKGEGVIYGIAVINNLGIMDRIEDELGATELEFERFNEAVKKVGSKFKTLVCGVTIMGAY